MRPVVVMFAILSFAEASLAAGSKPAAWKNIMPRNNLTGWTRVAIPPSHPLNSRSQWRVDAARHVIICEGNGGHEWLRYDHLYRNFVCELQWKLAKVPGVTEYNSGVFVRNSADGSTWYQAQVGSASGGYWFGDNPEEGVLKRFSLHSMLRKNHVKPAGEWNTYEMRCVGKMLVLWVNGAKQSVYTQCNNPQGYLGLEAEGSLIEFRGLRVKILP